MDACTEKLINYVAKKRRVQLSIYARLFKKIKAAATNFSCTVLTYTLQTACKQRQGGAQMNKASKNKPLRAKSLSIPLLLLIGLLLDFPSCAQLDTAAVGAKHVYSTRTCLLRRVLLRARA